ncbi:hypothetical protein [Streptomyces sp. NPDC049949]|uniref:hypothetical protein n=1 Tax=Streptomyces sp. NPDC049949 TaxID=3154627 RepID=UPI0034302D30
MPPSDRPRPPRPTGRRAPGMAPVLPGCFGTLPPGFAGRDHGTRVHPQGAWDGSPGPTGWIPPIRSSPRSRPTTTPRWARYFESLDRSLVSGTAPRAIDRYAAEDAWAHRTTGHPTRTSGVPYALARAVAQALPPAGALT